MLASATAACSLAVLGVVLWRGSTAGSGDSAPVPSRSSRTTEGVSPSGEARGEGPTTGSVALRDALVVVAGAVGVAVGALAVTAVLYDSGASLVAKVLALAGLLVGATAVGTSVSSRLGVVRPQRRSTATYRRSLSGAFGDVAGRSFVEYRSAAVRVRGGWVDDATLCVLAAATAGAPLGEVERWAADAAVVDADGIRNSVDALAGAGVVSVVGDRLRLDGDLARADAARIVERVATVDR
jgi:hypothetical protein